MSKPALVPTTVALALGLIAAGCATEGTEPSQRPRPTTTAAPSLSDAEGVEIAVAFDRRVADDETATFESVVRTTLTDPRGWQRAGFTFRFEPGAPYRIVLAEGDVVDRLCEPYDTFGRFSCQNGSVVALNAERWRHATPEWTGTLGEYRRMLVNHEVGHLLGQHHPAVQCPGPGQPAPVMAQQSTELAGCLPNPWPLDWEIECASLELEPLAPGYEPEAEPLCGPGGTL